MRRSRPLTSPNFVGSPSSPALRERTNSERLVAAVAIGLLRRTAAATEGGGLAALLERAVRRNDEAVQIVAVALERAGQAGPTIVANACDPLVVSQTAAACQ